MLSLKLYVVTEKLSCDMLDKVLKSPDGRLTERQTKFYMFQVGPEKSAQSFHFVKKYELKGFCRIGETA